MDDPSEQPVPASDPDPGELLAQVRDLVRSVKGFVFLTPSWRRKINSAATLPDRFYGVGAVAIEANEWLGTTCQLSGSEIRDMLHFSEGVTNLARELELLAKGLRSTAAARRGDVGQRLLLAYSLARRYNRNNDAQIIPHVYQMEEILRARRRRAATDTEPDDSSTPPDEP